MSALRAQSMATPLSGMNARREDDLDVAARPCASQLSDWICTRLQVHKSIHIKEVAHVHISSYINEVAQVHISIHTNEAAQ